MVFWFWALFKLIARTVIFSNDFLLFLMLCMGVMLMSFFLICADIEERRDMETFVKSNHDALIKSMDEHSVKVRELARELENLKTQRPNNHRHIGIYGGMNQ